MVRSAEFWLEAGRSKSEELVQEAMQLPYAGDSAVAQVAQNLVVRPELLCRWRSEHRRAAYGAHAAHGAPWTFPLAAVGLSTLKAGIRRNGSQDLSSPIQLS